MAKTISIVSNVPLTEPVIRNRLLPFFEAFKHHGYRVRCICPKSDFNAGKLPGDIMLEQVAVEFVKPGSFIKRALKEGRDASKLLKRAKALGDEQVLVTIPSMFLAFLAPIYLRRAIVFIDIRDLSWEYLAEASWLQRLAKRIFRVWFRRSIGFFKLVAATNEAEVGYIRRMDKQANPLHVTNGIRRQQFQQLKKTLPSTAKQFTVAYIGNIGLAQRLDTLVEAARRLPDIQFKIVGSGIDEPRIRDLLKQYGLENVEMAGRVSWEDVLKYYDSAHYLYAQLAPDFAGAMPSKLYEYLSTGKPVIYGGDGQAVETLNQFEGCHVVTPCEPVVLAEKLAELRGCADEQTLSLTNREKIEKNYIREKAAKFLVEKAVMIQ